MFFPGNYTAPCGLADGLSTISFGHHQGCPHWGCPDTGRARGGNLLPSGTGGSAHPRGKAAGRLLGPLPPDLAGDGQVSRIGLIPQPGKWRLIVDLSSLHGNDAITSDLCHMHYTPSWKRPPLFVSWEEACYWLRSTCIRRGASSCKMTTRSWGKATRLSTLPSPLG